MEVKWIVIGFAMVFGLLFASIGYESHTKAQCRIEAIKTGRSADEINKICK